ncbi:S9 family peptidase [Methylocapsa sp. S129]|uniref:S9 family peptidase n=1 Tax=Methylocapsa sp. S129 TaxID=1641869 RepID=UPI00131E9D53|nr:S9 family peptidase [Methylocapsa sp. S129]
MTLSKPLAKPLAAIIPPSATKFPETRSAHGVRWIDDYAWIRAHNWREVLRDPSALPPAIHDLLKAENAYAERALGPAKTLQRQLAREMRARLKEDDSEVPQPDGPFAYYARFRHGGQHKIFCRKPREGGKETILLDGDARAAGKAFFQFLDARHSPDHSKVAWSADEKGSEIFTLYVRDIDKAVDLDDIVGNCTGHVVWTRDSRGFLYVSLDENHRPCRVLLHRIGTPASDDVEVYEEADPAWFINIAATRLGALAIISVHGHDASEAHVVDLDHPALAPRLIAARQPGLRYDVMDHGDVFFIRANAGGAQDFKIVAASKDAPGMENWREFIPHRPGRLIVATALFKNFLARLERENGAPRIIVHELATGEEHAIAFDAETYFLGFEPVFEFDTPIFRFGFSSMSCPRETYDYDMALRQRMLRKKQMAPKDFDASAYVTRRIFALAPDGESVPISILHRRETPIDGTAPLLVYGYGAYGQVIDASFSTNRLSLVDRGFVYAIAHIRGGTDKGWRWYEEGKLARKANTFGDFIAATKHLVAHGFGAGDRVVAHGGSAGGMLMGAIANAAPQLYAAIIADVPFVDVLNTMLDADLPLTPPEWLEWGNPILDRTAFDTIRGYSPYDNVQRQDYPAILALAGLTDPRVTYWEPAKWVARLRAVMTGGGPIILKTNMDAGHAGASGRFDQLEDIALAYSFALTRVGSA